MKTAILFCLVLCYLNPGRTYTSIEELAAEIQELKEENQKQQEEILALKGLTIEERVEHLEELAKIKTLRSCHELAQHGITTSGKYNIDPDGDQIGKPPVEVICDFDNQQTVIHHDSEQLIVADHCDEVGCFEHAISYPAGKEQIEALIQISEHCEQSIEFGCFIAPLANEIGDNFGWWTDKKGDQQYFFTGDHIGEHVCKCGLDNSCLNVDGVERQCNCDAKVPDWITDEGIITAKDILPIQSVVYGPLQYDTEVANYTIGPLKCSGKCQEDPSSITCNSLKRSGISQSSVQILKTGYYPRLGYCDMESVEGYEGNMETLMTYLDVNSLPGGVYFAGIRAIGGGGYVNSPVDIIYSKALINIGNGFKADTGHFVAPIAGSYEFSFTARGNNAYVYVRVNGGNVYYFPGPGPSQYEVESRVFNLKLEKGDDVNLYLSSGEFSCTSDQIISFIGRLVSEV